MGTLNTTGQISMNSVTAGQSIGLALGLAAGAQVSINTNAVRALVGNYGSTFPTNVQLGPSFWGKNAPTVRASFAFGNTVVGVTGSVTSVKNLLSNTGAMGADVTGVGTARNGLAAASYGFDKGIYGFGFTTANVGMTNLLGNTGVIATDVAAVGTARNAPMATPYGFDKAIFYGGFTTVAVTTSNLVSNAGVVATNVTSAGTARMRGGGVQYGYDKGIFAFGQNQTSSATFYNVSNLVSNVGVVAANSTGVGTARGTITATGYGYDRAICCFALTTVVTSVSNLISNTGVVATDTAAVAGATNRYGTMACAFGFQGSGMFAFGNNSTSVFNTLNQVSNTGVIAVDSTGTGTARQRGAACGYALS